MYLRRFIRSAGEKKKNQHFLQNKAKMTIIQKLIMVISGIASYFIVLNIFESLKSIML